MFVTNFRICFKPFCKLCSGFRFIALAWLDTSVCVRRHHLAILLVQHLHLLGPVDTIAQVRLDAILADRSLILSFRIITNRSSITIAYIGALGDYRPGPP